MPSIRTDGYETIVSIFSKAASIATFSGDLFVEMQSIGAAGVMQISAIGR
jgi:hypothetical protein